MKGLKKKVIIIGSGFAGLSAASFMAKAGWNVTVVEKQATPGGRAMQMKAEGFTFDMGPSWYWMPDVFERYFRQFGKSVSDYYSLERFNPSYRVFWNDGPMDIPADYHSLKKLFDSIEPGSGEQLEKFLKQAADTYESGFQKIVFKPGQSLTEFPDQDLAEGLFRLDVFNSMRSQVAKYFTNPRLKELMEFPVLFLGALPQQIPALYSLINPADGKGGTWYPSGGMYCVVQAMYDLAVELGVQFHFNQEVTKIKIEKQLAKKVIAHSSILGEVVYEVDVVIGGADYHHIETKLLPKGYQSFSENYWETRVMAPGCLLYYVGLNKRLEGMLHHSLFFDTSFDVHEMEIYSSKEWPTSPLFYVSTRSISDASLAPEGCENLFLLIPVAAGLKDDTEALRDRYFEMIITRMEKHLGQSIKDAIVYKKTFSHSDFIHEYHAFKGNGYGLANTLRQTAILKPGFRSKKVKNLFFAGQLTVPGPGIPPCLISGEVVAGEVVKAFGGEPPVVRHES